MPRVFIKTLGCKVNRADSDDLSARIAEAGGECVQSAAEADVVIVNTCTVTAEADRKVRKELRRAASLDTVRQVIATGCAARLHGDELEALDSKIVVLTDLSEMLNGIFAVRSKCSSRPRPANLCYLPAEEDLKSCTAECSESPTPCRKLRVRVPVKIQDGCENFCSYCIVPYARGKCRSVPADEVVAKVRRLADAGTKEVVLTGINLGNYSDAGTGDLSALLTRLKQETALHRVRLSSIEPPQVSSELLAHLTCSTFLCEHLHIPLQSGSDRVLRDMNRQYTSADFLKLIKKIREAAPRAAITTDIIVGYPTETEDDFAATLAFAQEVGFAKTHVFRYSPRPGTPAAELTPLPAKVVADRARTLQDRADMDALTYKKTLRSKNVEAIIETIDHGSNIASATTREYLRLRLPAAGRSVGELLTLCYDCDEEEPCW